MSLYTQIKDRLLGNVSEKALTNSSITYYTSDLALGITENQLEQSLFNSSYEDSLYLQTALTKIQNVVSAIDFQLYELLNSKGEALKIEDHPILSLLDHPNPYQIKGEVLNLFVSYFVLRREFFLRIITENNAGIKPVALMVLNPSDVEVVVNKDTSELEYKVNAGESIITLKQNEVIHRKVPDPRNPLRGLAITKALANRITVEQVGLKYLNNKFYTNNNPDVILVKKGSAVTKEVAQEMKQSYLNSFKGSEEKNNVAVISGDVDVKVPNVSNVSVNTNEALDKARDDIMMLLGVGKSLYTTDDVNRANAEAGLEQFMRQTIVPMVRVFVEAINEGLVIPFFGEEYYLDTQKLLTEDKASLLSEITTTVEGKVQILTINEARQRLGYEPVEDETASGLNQITSASPFGTPYTIQNAFKSRRMLYKRFKLEERYIDTAKKQAIVKVSENPVYKTKYLKAYNTLQDHSAHLLDGVARSYFLEQGERVKAKIDKAIQDGVTKLNASDLFDKKEEREMFQKQVMPVYEKIASLAGNLALLPVKALKPETKYNVSDNLRRKLTKRARFAGGSVVDTTFDAIHDVVLDKMSEGLPAVARELQAKYDDMTPVRANMIARTESCYVSSMSTQASLSESEVVSGKQWFNSSDNLVRDEHDDFPGGNGNQIVDKDEPFLNGEMFPGESTINCRCAMAGVVDLSKI